MKDSIPQLPKCHGRLPTLSPFSRSLQDQALRLLVTRALLGEQGSTSGIFENFTDTVVRFGRALEVGFGSDLLLDFFTLEVYTVSTHVQSLSFPGAVHGTLLENSYLFWGHWLLRRFVKFLDGFWVVAEIFLTSNKDDG